VNETSRRKFLGSLGPFTFVPLIRTTPELTFSKYNGDAVKANVEMVRAQTMVTDEVQTVTVKNVQCRN
jgi:hypothetical protein